MTVAQTNDPSATATEIGQQPRLWRQVGHDVARAADLRRQLTETAGGRRIVLTGAGTSAYVGDILAPVLARGGRPVESVATTTVTAGPASVFADDVPTLLVSFARSGDSPESLAAVALADDLLTDCRHLVVTCNPTGRLATERVDDPRTDVVVMPPGSNDRGFAMTSSFTCMLLAARLLLGNDLDPVAVSERLAGSAEETFAARGAEAAQRGRNRVARVVYLGSGAFHGLARESALKLLELTAGRTVALAESSLGFRHGPKAFLDAEALAVVYVSSDPYTRQYDLDIARELAGQLPPDQVVLVGADPSDATGTWWPVPGLGDLDDALRAVPAVVGAQLLALEFSRSLGLDPDNPFPDRTVNRVVEGVTVHPWPPVDLASVR